LDFHHHKQLSQQEIESIEDLVNETIRTDAKVSIYELDYAIASQQKEIKQFFADKYGKKVRVVDVPPSKELCGGTHVGRLGVIGLFRIAKESSIAAGVRRIEAVTGKHAEHLCREIEKRVLEAASTLKITPALVPEKIVSLIEQQKKLEQELKNAKKTLSSLAARELIHTGVKVGNVLLLATCLNQKEGDAHAIAEALSDQMSSYILVLGWQTGLQAHLLVKVSPDLAKKQISADHIIKQLSPFIDGKGGGKDLLAIAGGKRPGGLKEAIEKAQGLLRALL